MDCRSQAEVDALWERLSAGGETLQCGWLKDKFGVSWQIIPSQMKKIDIEALRRAHAALGAP